MEDSDQRQVQLLGLQRDVRGGRQDQRPPRRGRPPRGRLHALPDEQQNVSRIAFRVSNVFAIVKLTFMYVHRLMKECLFT
jgi:hypothetical protein